MHGKKLLIGYGSFNPQGTGQLGLEHEQKEIGDGLILGAARLKEVGIKPVNATIKVVPALSVTGLAMLANMRPDILIISGHGAGKPGLCMAGEDGKLMMVPPQQITDILRGTHIPFLALSCCFTFEHAEDMERSFKTGARGLPRWVVGTSKAVSDPGAKAMARTFASVCMTPGMTVARMFRQGHAAAEATAPGSKDIIRLYNLDPEKRDPDDVLVYETEDGTRSSGDPEITLEFLGNEDDQVIDSRSMDFSSLGQNEEESVQQVRHFTFPAQDRSRDVRGRFSRE